VSPSERSAPCRRSAPSAISSSASGGRPDRIVDVDVRRRDRTRRPRTSRRRSRSRHRNHATSSTALSSISGARDRRRESRSVSPLSMTASKRQPCNEECRAGGLARPEGGDPTTPATLNTQAVNAAREATPPRLRTERAPRHRRDGPGRQRPEQPPCAHGSCSRLASLRCHHAKATLAPPTASAQSATAPVATTASR